MAGRRRAGAFGSVERRTNKKAGGRPQIVWRPVWSCRACQTEADAAWQIQAQAAAATDQPEPKRPRIQHKGSWDTSRAAAQVTLEEVRREQDAARLAGLPATCWLDDHHGSGRKGDAAVLGQPLGAYAERVLTRSTGAEQTRADDQKLWQEKVTIPAVSTRPLGLAERFQWTPVKAITRADVRTWLRETERRPGRGGQGTLSASQVRQRFYLLRRILAEALADGEIDVDPSAGIKPPPLPAGRAVTGLLRSERDGRWLPTGEQMQALVGVCDPRSRLALALMFGCGLRAGEATALERRDLVGEGPGRWLVRISKSESQAAAGRTRSDTKTHRAAVRHLPGWVGAEADAHLARLPDLKPEDRLFPPVGRVAAASLSHTALRRDLAGACVALSLPTLSLQDLRAAGEADVARRLGRPAAAEWARHGLQVQMAHYVAAEQAVTSAAAAGWD